MLHVTDLLDAAGLVLLLVAAFLVAGVAGCAGAAGAECLFVSWRLAQR